MEANGFNRTSISLNIDDSFEHHGLDKRENGDDNNREVI